MRKTYLAVFAALAAMLMAGTALAQVEWLIPPPFEVQRDIYWDFEDPDPLEPEYYGPDDDLLKGSDFTDWDGLDFFEGKMGIDNRQGDGYRDGWAVAHLDNWERDYPEKLIWYQVRLFLGPGSSWEGHWQMPEGYEHDAQSVTQEEHGDGSITYLVSAWAHPNPPWEEALAIFGAPVGEVVWIDDLRIATACIPEPGLTGLVGLGVLGLLARRKK